MSEMESSEKLKQRKKYKRFQYTHNDLVNAVEAIVSKKKSLNQVHRETGIPKATLSTKVNNKVPLERKMGPPSVLSIDQESQIVNWIMSNAKVGFPVHPEQLKDSVHCVLKESPKQNCFTNNRPGIKWLNLFLKRHPEIKKRNAEIISKTRAKVTERSIQSWFSDVRLYLEGEGSLDILNDPRRILNCDETGLQLCPKSGKVLGPRTMSNFYEVARSAEKENITVLCTYSADGKSLPPMIIYPYKRIPLHIAQSLPDNWAIGRSDSGWMVSATFYEYVANVVYPWLVENKIEFPVILYVDGHKSHLSLELSQFCCDKKIHLYCLLPNSTHILQPCDVSIFKPLKSYWKEVTRAHNLNSKSPITKNNFGIIFKKAFDKVKPESIINGFRTCGLYPFNPDAVDYNKCIPTRIAELQQPKVSFSIPISNDYLVCKNVINYILRDHELEDVISNNTLLAKIWNECNSKSDDNIITNYKTTQEFNILDMPIEIEGSTFMFTENELELSGIEELNEESLVTNSENYIMDSNIDNFNLDLVEKKNVCSNIFGNVKNSTNLLYNVDKVDSENIYEEVENTIKLSGVIQNKETDNQTKNSTQQIWDKHFKWSKEENSDLKNKNKTIPVPYAITSSKWMLIQKEKEDKKLAKETLILEKRHARLMKKNETENKRKSREINEVPINKPKVINTKDVLNLEETNFEAQKIKKTLNVDDYVIVIYEGEYFPGVIKSIKKSQSMYKVINPIVLKPIR